MKTPLEPELKLLKIIKISIKAKKCSLVNKISRTKGVVSSCFKNTKYKQKRIKKHMPTTKMVM